MSFMGKGGYRKRLLIVDMLRKQARLPHELTWIELDPRPYREQTLKAGIKLTPSSRTIVRRGFLIKQHPAIETAFWCAEYHAQDNMDDLAVSYVGFAWCSDDSTPVPWKQYQHSDPTWRRAEYGEKTSRIISPLPTKEADEDLIWSDSEFLVGMLGYNTIQAYLVPAASPAFYAALAKREATIEQIWKHRALARAVWTLLATINDIPVLFDKVEPSRGYIARGSYRKFLTHSIIHLTVPQKQWRKLTAHVLMALRRRAHQVRGFWRKDWRHPLRTTCTHDFDDDMVCRCCGGHKIWVHEHQRGDASLGFVTHDFEVHHDPTA
jgi:hypothetical protein